MELRSIATCKRRAMCGADLGACARSGLQVIGVGKKEIGRLFAELFKIKGRILVSLHACAASVQDQWLFNACQFAGSSLLNAWQCMLFGTHTARVEPGAKIAMIVHSSEVPTPL